MILATFDQWLSTHLPEAAGSLNAGVTQQALDGARAAGLPLPDSLVALYRWHDGQQPSCRTGIFYGMRFLCLAEAMREWRSRGQHAPAAAKRAAGAINAGGSNRRWTPFATDDAGNFLAVDLDPGRLGVSGQVITLGPKASPQQVLASDALQFVAWLVEQLEGGNFSIAAQEGGHAFNTLRPAAEHFMDAVRGIVAAEPGQPQQADAGEGMPGTIESIRTLLTAQADPRWKKLFITGRLSGAADRVNAECEYSLRGSEDRQPLVLADPLALGAALLELRQRMKLEMNLGWRSIEMEYDADERYSVSIDTK